MSDLNNIFSEEEIAHIKGEVEKKKQNTENEEALKKWKENEGFNELVEKDQQLKTLIEQQPSVVTNTDLFTTLVTQAKDRYLSSKKESEKKLAETEKTEVETKTETTIDFLGQNGTSNTQDEKPKFDLKTQPLDIFRDDVQKELNLSENERILLSINKPNGDTKGVQHGFLN